MITTEQLAEQDRLNRDTVDTPLTPNEVAEVISDSLEELSNFMSTKNAEVAQTIIFMHFGMFLEDKSKTRSVYKFNFKDFYKKALDK